MSSPLPSTQFRKLKDKSLRAIVFAILLHILIAIIIYFSLFYKSPSIDAPTAKIDYQRTTLIDKTKDDDNTPFESSEESTSDVAIVKDISKHIKKDSNIDTNYKTDNKKLNIDQNSREASKRVRDIAVEPDSISVLDDSNVNTVESVAQPEYTLKQTQEYKQLDADIDKDSEQLSKLINEVKQRNQSQIENHHLPKATLNPASNTATVPHDYPITPINNQ